MPKHTIRDIARLAGVSRSTVSLVLNDSPNVNERTRRHVLDVIEKVNYHPSAQARGLVSRQSRALALIAPESDEVFRNFYLADTVAGVLDAIGERGYKLVIESTARRPLGADDVDALFMEQRVDGALVVGGRWNDALVPHVRDAGHPICLINARYDGTPSASADNVEGASMAARHLAALGHDDIAYIRGPDDRSVARDRHEGFVRSMDDLGLALPPERTAFGAFTEYSGYEAMGKLLRQCPVAPSALFAASDMMALGAMLKLREAGLDVPGDVAVVGADDILLASYTAPTLSTVRQSLAELGRTAAELLLVRIDGKQAEAEQRILPAPLVIRESCGAQARPT